LRKLAGEAGPGYGSSFGTAYRRSRGWRDPDEPGGAGQGACAHRTGFQHFNLWPHLTVIQNLIAGPIHVQRRNKDEVVAEAEVLLERVGLASKRNDFPARLSGGQKQRVGIARALAMKPELLLFDEPTSALDPELVGEVVTVMKQLAESGSTMLVVTHEMGFARETADEIVLIDDGRIVETAAPAEFFTKPRTERARQFLQRYVR
jgi:polar amino acid transport system ATP-binding protein